MFTFSGMLAYITRPDLVNQNPQYYSAILNGIILSKCIASQLWENSQYVCRQLKGIGPAFSTMLVTAGKTNFMLLEESHPRDLERVSIHLSSLTGFYETLCSFKSGIESIRHVYWDKQTNDITLTS